MLLWACSEPPPPQPQPECVEDTDCAEDEVCSDGQCVPILVQCQDDADCAADEMCLDGQCVPIFVQCEQDGDCAEDEICVDNACEPAPPECELDEDCLAGEVCVDGTCTAPQCSSNGDCAEGQVCFEGNCVEIIPECEQDSDCAEDEMCLDGQCLPVLNECASDDDCEPGEVCIEGECIIEEPECIDDEECGACESCIDGACELQDLELEAGDDQIVLINSEVTMDCSLSCADLEGELVWNEIGSDLLGISDAADPLVFNAPDSAQQLVLECALVTAEETLVDTAVVDVIEEEFVEFNDRAFDLDIQAFAQGQSLSSTDDAQGSSLSPGGLQAHFVSTLTVVASMDFECVSGPLGADDCDLVDILDSDVPDDGESVARYIIAPDQNASVLQLGNDGAASSVSNIVLPGSYTFRATASDGGPLAQAEAEYTVYDGFQIMLPDINQTAIAFDGLVSASGVPTVYSVTLGTEPDPQAQLTVVANSAGGILAFELVPQNGTEIIGLEAVQITLDRENAQEILVPLFDDAIQAEGTYELHAAFDSDLGSEADVPSSDTGIRLIVEPAAE